MKLNMKNSLLLKVVIVASMTLSLNAKQTVDYAELQSFAVQKYKVDFKAQTDKSKQDILNEYVQTLKLNEALLSTMKDDSDLKVATAMARINIWSQKYMANINPSDKELKKLYKVEKPKVSARYRLRNILVKDEAQANKLLKQLAKLKKTKLAKFKELAKNNSIDLNTKNNEGYIGFIDTNKLDKNIQATLKNKKAGAIVKVNVANVGTQILFVEEYQGERKATFEESEQILINLARQEALKEEINKIMPAK